MNTSIAVIRSEISMQRALGSVSDFATIVRARIGVWVVLRN